MRISVSDEAEKAALAEGRLLTREKAREIKRMSVDEINRWAVGVYGAGFRNGVEAVQEAMEEEAAETEEVSVEWEDVLEVIGRVKGIGPKMLKAIDEKLREEY